MRVLDLRRNSLFSCGAVGHLRPLGAPLEIVHPRPFVPWGRFTFCGGFLGSLGDAEYTEFSNFVGKISWVMRISNKIQSGNSCCVVGLVVPTIIGGRE